MHFLRNTGAPTGRMRLRNRILAARGYEVVSLPVTQWPHSDAEEQRAYLERKVRRRRSIRACRTRAQLAVRAAPCPVQCAAPLRSAGAGDRRRMLLNVTLPPPWMFSASSTVVCAAGACSSAALHVRKGAAPRDDDRQEQEEAL